MVVLAEALSCRIIRSAAVSKMSDLPLPLHAVSMVPFVSGQEKLTTLKMKLPVRWTALCFRRRIRGHFIVEQTKTGLKILAVSIRDESGVQT